MMARLVPWAVVGLALSAVATTTLGQSQPGATAETGSLINRRDPAQIRGETTLAARMTLREFGNCTVRRSPKATFAVVNLPFGTRAFDKAIHQVAQDECLSDGMLVIPQYLMRGAIFEALYLLEFGRDANPNPNLKAAPSFDYTIGYQRPVGPEAANTIALAIVGDCVVRTVPAAAHRLLTSLPGSQLESDSISTIARELPGCVPPNQTFRFQKSIIRAALAEAMYRLSSGTRRQAERG
jgi:hypothetical protein